MSPGVTHTRLLTQKQRRKNARDRKDCGQCYKRYSGEEYRCTYCKGLAAAKTRVRTPEYRESDAVRRAARRVEAVDAGMCKTCCIRVSRAHSKYCEECGNSDRRRDEFLVCCAAFGGHRDGCHAEHAEAIEQQLQASPWEAQQ